MACDSLSTMNFSNNQKIVESKARHFFLEKGCNMKTAIRMSINDQFGGSRLEYRKDLFTVTREKLNV